MIAVIADDFTGAAEIGGIGLRYGLKTVIETHTNKPGDTDLLILATRTRSLSPHSATTVIDRITRELSDLKPSFIFKKLDSVLRGHIVGELHAQIKASGKKRAVIVAANPWFGRIIKDGVYYINGIPVDKTDFSRDPLFPVRTAVITRMFSNGGEDIFSVPAGHEIPEKGLVFGDAVSEADMMWWAGKIDDHTIPAGGSGFFEALLATRFPGERYSTQENIRLGNKVLFVSGSTYPKKPAEILHFRESGYVFLDIPAILYSKTEADQKKVAPFVKDVCHHLRENGKVVISINESLHKNLLLSFRIRESIGLVVNEIYACCGIDDLFVEGGDTTAVVCEYLGISKMSPYRELGRGVIQMKSEKYPGLCITTKPGSYSWPESIIGHDKINCETVPK